MKKLFILTLALCLFSVSAWPVPAQDQPTQQASTEEQEKEKAERERNAYRLLDQLLDEAQSLRLPENRVRVQITGADMLWDQNQGRARSLFAMAAEGVAEIGRSQAPVTNRRFAPGNNATYQGDVGPPNFRSYQLRQELVLTAARHDAALAYQLLAATKPAVPLQPADQRPRASFTSDESLEQMLLGRVAALDPKFAAQNAEQMMDKGQFPIVLPEVISQLQRQDPEAAAKLADKTVKKIQATNLLTNTEANGLVQALLRSGPRTANQVTPPVSGRALPAVLEQSSYVDLLSSVIDAALKVTSAGQNLQRTAQTPQRGRGQNTGRTNTPPTDAQIEQNNARRLLAGIQIVMPMVDQYLPGKAPLVRQKMSEMGMGGTNVTNAAQMFNGMQAEITTDALVQAAANAPQQMKSRLYQQAAYKAIEDGDTERARQIATDHLQNNARDAVMKRIDFRELSKKAEGARIDEVRQAVARLQSDNEKIDLLLQVAGDSQKSNPKLALQLLEEAKQITSHRATTYDHFEQQLKVAHAFASVDPARSFEVLDPGISQLNELLAAAAVLSGFEINMFRDGEMAIQGGNGLTAYVNRFGQELAVLARSDFERSETLAGRFQFAEPRIMTRLAIVQGLLGVKPVNGGRTILNTLSETMRRN